MRGQGSWEAKAEDGDTGAQLATPNVVSTICTARKARMIPIDTDKNGRSLTAERSLVTPSQSATLRSDVSIRIGSSFRG